MITYQSESVADCLDEIIPHLEAHHEEAIGDGRQLDPDFDRYLELDDAGAILLVTARYRGALVGYVLMFLAPNLHYRDRQYAISDLIYLDPKHRRGRNGSELIEFALNQLADSGGAWTIHVHIPVRRPFRAIIERLGFQLIEENWRLDIDD